MTAEKDVPEFEESLGTSALASSPKPPAGNDTGSRIHSPDLAESIAHAVENAALAGEVWQEADNVLLLCVEPGKTWQDFNGQRFPWDAPTVARPLRRLLDRAGNLAPEYGKTRPIPSGSGV